MNATDHKAALRDMLAAEPLTFRNAKRRYTVGDDLPLVLVVAARYWQAHKAPTFTKRLSETLACGAFWQLYEERKGR